MSHEGISSFHISDEPHVHMADSGIHYVEGEMYHSVDFACEPDAEREEVREVIADAKGLDREQVQFDDEFGRTETGRKFVGFQRWRSSWDPHAPKGDPNLN